MHIQTWTIMYRSVPDYWPNPISKRDVLKSQLGRSFADTTYQCCNMKNRTLDYSCKSRLSRPQKYCGNHLMVNVIAWVCEKNLGVNPYKEAEVISTIQFGVFDVPCRQQLLFLANLELLLLKPPDHESFRVGLLLMVLPLYIGVKVAWLHLTIIRCG